MPWPIYSERLLSSGLQDVWVNYHVPVGRRAVVKCITAVQWATVTGSVVVSVGAYEVIRTTVPGSGSIRFPELTVPVYGGENITAALSGGGVVLTVSGFLFDDPTGAAAPPAAAAGDPWDGGPWVAEP